MLHRLCFIWIYFEVTFILSSFYNPEKSWAKTDVSMRTSLQHIISGLALPEEISVPSWRENIISCNLGLSASGD